MPDRSASVGAARCPACDTVSDRIVWREAGYVGKACDCGNVFIDPPPVLSETERAHDGHFRTYYSRPAELRLAWISRFRSSGRLLEVGSGAGDLLQLARARGFRVTGVEPNPACAEHVRGLGIDVECAFIERSALPLGEFDVVYHVDLLNHFPDPSAALRAMAARLNVDGILCLEVGILGGISPAWYRYMGGVGFPQHRFLYSEAGLQRLLERAGLEVVGMKTFGLAASLMLYAVRHCYGREFRERLHRRHELGRFRPRQAALPPLPSGMVSLYDWLTYVLRYRLGPVVPRWGPLTAFVAARPSRA